MLYFNTNILTPKMTISKEKKDQKWYDRIVKKNASSEKKKDGKQQALNLVPEDPKSNILTTTPQRHYFENELRTQL